MRYVIALAANYDYVNAAETTLKSIFYHNAACVGLLGQHGYSARMVY